MISITLLLFQIKIQKFAIQFKNITQTSSKITNIYQLTVSLLQYMYIHSSTKQKIDFIAMEIQSEKYELTHLSQFFFQIQRSIASFSKVSLSRRKALKALHT